VTIFGLKFGEKMTRKSCVDIPSAHSRNAAVDYAPRGLGDSNDGSDGVTAADVDN
jgi:hypothetical protein